MRPNMIKDFKPSRLNLSLILWIALSLTRTLAQERDLHVFANLGLGTPFLDKGIGIHLGLNPSCSLFRFLSLEGQASYLYTRTTSAFISGKRGNSHSWNLLAGGRLYFHSKERKNRFYINLLVGGNYLRENLHGEKYLEEFNPGLSLGSFLELKSITFGLSLESPENLIFKLGYKF